MGPFENSNILTNCNYQVAHTPRTAFCLEHFDKKSYNYIKISIIYRFYDPIAVEKSRTHGMFFKKKFNFAQYYKQGNLINISF